MHELLGAAPGELLTRSAYDEDFGKREWAVDGYDSWKLERQQYFREPDDASWNAFARGDWREALRLIEAERGDFLALSEEAAKHDCRLLRVRVVERPIIPYLQWELHLLRVRAECGELIRVVGLGQIEPYETEGPLPELVTLGSDTVYKVVYKDGVLDGAIRFVDSAITARVTAFIEQLYEHGEDISTFFEREVAHLEPPRGD
jgi:hypothetical protein